ncbi:hypothetical protein L6164_017433 [Bauhinia variegata]|uniref:Uncharacterized protein n=1 Tax=Bauhinia variegata TaxID=167791 RepID=A0ACB9N7R1_BAUVA|nr:hypothetical protein L6164_017433 [Bauhinia variegata]
MESAGFHSHPVLRFPRLLYSSKHNHLGKSSISLKDIAVGASSFVPHKGVCWLTISSTKLNGEERGKSHRRNFAPASAEKGDGKKNRRSFDGKGAKPEDQEDIIALLKRIQVSISKDNVRGSDKTSSDSYKEKDSVESMIDVFRVSEKQSKGKPSSGERKKNWTKRRGISRKEQGIQKHNPPVTTGFKLTRLPSNFEKKSPIPYLSPPRGRALELNSEPLPVTSENTREETVKLEKMKLLELKELAKSRGIKGYSKLKKGELVEKLRS